MHHVGIIYASKNILMFFFSSTYDCFIQKYLQIKKRKEKMTGKTNYI